MQRVKGSGADLASHVEMAKIGTGVARTGVAAALRIKR
jgi:hypothetical protein